MQSCQQLNVKGQTKQKALQHDQNSALKLCQASGPGEASTGKKKKHFSFKCHHWPKCLDLIEADSSPDFLQLPSVQIIASAHYMLSELFQLDEPPQEDGEESLRAGGSEESYSDDDGEDEGDAELSEDSDDSVSYSKQDDRKAVAVIRSVGELSIPEKYKSTHQIRVSASYRVSSVWDKRIHMSHVSTEFNVLFSNPCSQVVLSPFLKTRRRNADMS